MNMKLGALGQGSRANAILQWNVDVLDRTPPAWLERGDHAHAVKVYSEPIREQIAIPVREQLIVELYSK